MDANLVCWSANADLVVIDLLLKGIAVDTEHLRGLHLIPVVREERKLNERLLDLFDNDVVKAVQLNLSFTLLLEEHFEFALNEFLETDTLEICDKKIIRVVQTWGHASLTDPAR